MSTALGLGLMSTNVNAGTNFATLFTDLATSLTSGTPNLAAIQTKPNGSGVPAAITVPWQGLMVNTESPDFGQACKYWDFYLASTIGVAKVRCRKPS